MNWLLAHHCSLFTSNPMPLFDDAGATIPLEDILVFFHPGGQSSLADDGLSVRKALRRTTCLSHLPDYFERGTEHIGILDDTQNCILFVSFDQLWRHDGKGDCASRVLSADTIKEDLDHLCGLLICFSRAVVCYNSDPEVWDTPKVGSDKLSRPSLPSRSVASFASISRPTIGN